MEELRFIARISKSGGGGTYVIYIPREVVEKYRDVIEQWYQNQTRLIVEIKVLHGSIRT